jgi:hypothetical protein
MNDVWDIPPPTPEQDFADRVAHYEKMRAKVRELRGYYVDAMRYRWLRSTHEDGDGQWFVYGAKSPEVGALDAEIDAEMAKQPPR